MKERKWIKEILDKLPYVKWDRFVAVGEITVVYGWIKKENTFYKDFVLLEFSSETKSIISMNTSSVKYSKELSEFCGFEDHFDCELIKDL